MNLHPVIQCWRNLCSGDITQSGNIGKNSDKKWGYGRIAPCLIAKATAWVREDV